jgi:hypothetical protein
MLVGYLRFYYKKQELIALHKHMGLLQVFGGVHVTHRFSFLCLFIFFVPHVKWLFLCLLVKVLFLCLVNVLYIWTSFFLCSVNVFSVWRSCFYVQWMFSTYERLVSVFSECFLDVNVLFLCLVNVFCMWTSYFCA